MQKLAIFDYFPAVVKLGGKRGPVGINILTVEISTNGRQGDINLNATYTDIIKLGLFCGRSLPINL